MKFMFTYGEILEHGNWEKFCDVNGYNEYLINEGFVDSSDVVVLSISEIFLFDLDSYIKSLSDKG